jgi:hypothetical protein
LKKYNFRKPKKQVSPNEQISLISILDYEEDHQNEVLQQQQSPLHQEEHTEEQIPKIVHIPNKKHMKRISW